MTTIDYAKMTKEIDDLTEDLEDMTACNQNNEIEVERLTLLLNESQELLDVQNSKLYDLYDKIENLEAELKNAYDNFESVIDSKKMKRNLITEVKILAQRLRRYDIEF